MDIANYIVSICGSNSLLCVEGEGATPYKFYLPATCHQPSHDQIYSPYGPWTSSGRQGWMSREGFLLYPMTAILT